MPHAPGKVADSRKRLSAISMTIVTVGVIVTAVSLLLWGSKQSRRSQTVVASAAALDECSGWNAPWATTTTRTITVRGEWITESIPFCYGLDMDPIEGPILYRLRDGRLFKKTPDGQRFTLNGEPAPRVRVPGNSVAIRSESGDSVRVILTAEPKS